MTFQSFILAASVLREVSVGDNAHVELSSDSAGVSSHSTASATEVEPINAAASSDVFFYVKTPTQTIRIPFRCLTTLRAIKSIVASEEDLPYDKIRFVLHGKFCGKFFTKDDVTLEEYNIFPGETLLLLTDETGVVGGAGGDGLTAQQKFGGGITPTRGTTNRSIKP